MPTLSLRRRDPWWGLEGPAAKRRYRYQRFVRTTAFLASLIAVGGAAVAWAVEIGIAAMLGFHVALAIA